jgi:hypothetical protein
MMKKTVIILLALVLAFPAFSQLKFGIKAGVSTTNLTMSTLKTITSGTTSYTVDALTQAKYGFHGGAFLRLKILALYIQPEVLLATASNDYSVTNVQTSAKEIVTQKMNKLEIPVMVGLKFGPLRVNAGPSASLLLNTPKELINSPDFENMYSKTTFGYQAGVGLDILKTLTVDLRYEGSLKKYQNQIQNLAGTKFNLDDRPNAFLLSVGLMF